MGGAYVYIIKGRGFYQRNFEVMSDVNTTMRLHSQVCSSHLPLGWCLQTGISLPKIG